MKNWVAASFIPGGAGSKSLNHLLAKSKCLLQKFDTGRHQYEYIHFAVQDSLVVEIKVWLQIFLIPPFLLGFFFFGQVSATDVITQWKGTFSQDIPVLHSIGLVRKKSLVLLQLKPFGQGC